MCVRITVHNCHTQHSTELTVLIIFSANHRTVIIAQMLSTWVEEINGNQRRCTRFTRVARVGLYVYFMLAAFQKRRC